MRLLDLFCGAGGASMGYYQSGFTDIVGVDIAHQKNYPFEFIQDNAFEYLEQYGKQFDVIHASPKCQAFTNLWHLHKKSEPDQITPLRPILEKLKKPYIIENVEGSPLDNPLMLCGTMFNGLRVIRHRLFETFPMILFHPYHIRPHPLCFTHDKRKKHYGKLDEMTSFVQVTGGGNCSISAAKDAMGIDWMNKSEINQSIPPAYTKWIGEQILRMI